MAFLALLVVGANPDIVDAPVSAGATPDLVSGDGVTALMWAAQRGDIRLVQPLLSAGAQADRQDQLLGWTALHYAAAYGREDVYKVLVDTGGNVGKRDEQGRTAEQLLKKGGDKK